MQNNITNVLEYQISNCIFNKLIIISEIFIHLFFNLNLVFI